LRAFVNRNRSLASTAYQPQRIVPLIVRLEPLTTPTAVRRFDSVLCFGDSDWWYHNRGHADMQFIRRFARRCRVLYVNSLGVRTPSVSEGSMFFRRVTRKLGSLARFCRDGGEGFDVLSPLFAPIFDGPAGAAVQAALRWQLISVLRRLGMRRPLIWVACPTAACVLDRLPGAGVVHQLSDCYGALQGGPAAAATQMERRVANRADLVVCSSEKLVERAQRLYGQGEYVDHGVDFDLFDAAARARSVPPELTAVPHPIVGFFGNIDGNTVDRTLLDGVIRLRPQYRFVLVGSMTHEFDALKRLANVVAIPRQLYQRVAPFGATFDVCIMPWLQNEWIEHCNPVKLKEYLALGKPVVSTPFQELRRTDSLCIEAVGAEAFAAAIDRALREDNETDREKRRAWAAQNTWDAKFRQVVELLKARGIEFDA
jgi:glycosyltransferase involved in cell wall biosynthesis